MNLLSSLSHRRLQAEMMDQPGLDPVEHARALRGLARINLMSGSGGILFRAIEKIERANPTEPIRILDVASGGGDVALALAEKARKQGKPWSIEGCDISPTAIGHAQEKANAAGLSVRFFRHDALAGDFPGGYNIITSTLFFHHLEEPAVVGLLERMRKAAGVAVLIDDLARTRRGYALAWLGCRLLTRSKVVHNDGPISVESAFTPEEMKILAQRAGMENVSLLKHWPERYLLTWSR